jgi:hypothetical protein
MLAVSSLPAVSFFFSGPSLHFLFYIHLFHVSSIFSFKLMLFLFTKVWFRLLPSFRWDALWGIYIDVTLPSKSVIRWLFNRATSQCCSGVFSFLFLRTLVTAKIPERGISLDQLQQQRLLGLKAFTWRSGPLQMGVALQTESGSPAMGLECTTRYPWSSKVTTSKYWRHKHGCG